MMILTPERKHTDGIRSHTDYSLPGRAGSAGGTGAASPFPVGQLAAARTLESEALTLADSDCPDAALAWPQNRPDITTARSRWLLRLLMARVAEQTGKNELALHLLGELDGCAAAITLTQWEPDLLFEVKARRLKLLRMKAGRNDTDKTRLNPEMEHLLAGLIAIDAARAAVLCG
ncbi:hypothetical protein I4B37_003322 [Enterobacter hormaechei]|nr:hypothetical protein [Enterobacter hormaechei]HAZ0553242.1 hypothetical protein [Enterobacter hormaechei]